MSAKTLSEFTSELRQRNVSKPTLYYVEIIPPPIFKEAGLTYTNSDLNLVSMWCHTATTPQSTIQTQDNYLEAGNRRKYAYDQDYANLTLSFYVDQDYNVKRFFDQWKAAIVPQKRNFNYPDKYTAESLNLFIINQEGKETYKYEYSKVFPKSFNSIELSYSATGVASFTVDFVFEECYYTTMGKNDTLSSKPANKVFQENFEQIPK